MANRHERRRLKKEPRYQVVLELEGGATRPLIGSAPKDWCERVCESINRRLIKGLRIPHLNVIGASIAPVHAN